MKIAIIGCGNIGTKRAISIWPDKNTKIKYFVGPPVKRKNSKCKAHFLAKKFKGIYSTNWRKVISTDIDAVILATPPKLFFKIGTEVLKKGKHLLIEKPLGENLKQAKSLTKLAKKKKLVLKTGFNLRFDDAVIKAKSLVKKNFIGNKYFIKCNYVNGSVLTNTNKVGALKDIGCHCINLIQFFVNKKLDIVKSSIQKKEHSIDDNGFILVNSRNVLGSVHFSFVRWENDFNFEISGSRGSIQIVSLPKWGMQKLIFSKRIYPSGKPLKKIWKFNVDNSWKNEWLFFKKSIKSNKNKFDYSEGISNMQYLNLIRNKK